MEIKADRSVAEQHHNQINTSNTEVTGVPITNVSGGNSGAISQANALAGQTTSVLGRYSQVLADGSSKITMLSEILLEADGDAAGQISKGKRITWIEDR